MNLQEVYKKISEDIYYLFSCASDTLKYDKTFRARVIGPAANNKYIISYKNKEYFARCDCELHANDTVWVCAPCNDWSSLFIQMYGTR